MRIAVHQLPVPVGLYFLGRWATDIYDRQRECLFHNIRNEYDIFRIACLESMCNWLLLAKATVVYLEEIYKEVGFLVIALDVEKTSHLSKSFSFKKFSGTISHPVFAHVCLGTQLLGVLSHLSVLTCPTHSRLPPAWCLHWLWQPGGWSGGWARWLQ